MTASGAEAPSLCADDTQNTVDETTAGGALSAIERLLAHGISLPTDRDDGQPYEHN